MKKIAQIGIELVDKETRNFLAESETANAVELSTDQVEPVPSYQELMNNLVNAMQPDVSEQLKLTEEQLASARETFQQAQNLESMLQQSLSENNVIIPASDYMNMDANKRRSVIELGRTTAESGRPAIFMDLGDDVTGFNSSEGTVINTRMPHRTINVDELMKVDDKTFKKMLRGNQTKLFTEAGIDATLENTIAHEFTHFAEQSGKWEYLKNYVVEQVGGQENFDILKDRIGQIYKSRKI